MVIPMSHLDIFMVLQPYWIHHERTTCLVHPAGHLSQKIGEQSIGRSYKNDMSVDIQVKLWSESSNILKV